MTCKQTAGILGLGWLFGVDPSSALAQTPAGGVDVAAYRDKLLVTSDGKGHFVAVTPMGGSERALFYGDGKVFYEVRLVGGSRNGDKWDHAFADPRLAEGNREEGSGYVGFDGTNHRVECGKRVTQLTALPAADAKKMLEAAQFQKSPRKYRPYALARDNMGNYYYVDRGYRAEDKDRFRVFVGPKGNLKPQQMVNVVSDPAGDLFATKRGSLRLLLNKEPQDLRWMPGKKAVPLTRVPLDFNTMIASIYNDFGVYAGERLGTPCDDL